MKAVKGRIIELDVYRFLTVSFALWSHAFINHGVGNVIGPDTELWLRSITRSATPSLIFLFGVMAELVYFRRTQESAFNTRLKLIHRALQCYVAFIVLAALGVLVGRSEPIALVGNLILAKPAVYANIFSLYFFWLLALVPLLFVRQRWGFGGLFLLVGLIWGVDIAFVSTLEALPFPFSHWGGLMYGIGDNWGPSAIHGISLIVAGMLLGKCIYGQQVTRTEHGLALTVVLACAVAIALEIHRAGLVEFFQGVVNYRQYRAHNASVFYAYGVIAALVLIALAKTVSLLTPHALLTPVREVGQRTFSYFLIGNAVLVLVTGLKVSSLGEALILQIGYLLLFGLLTLAWAKVSKKTGLGKYLNDLTLKWVSKSYTPLLSIGHRFR